MENNKIKNFKDLESWKFSHNFVLSIYKISVSFPEQEKFGLTNQMRRASVSVTSNIVEGFGRSTKKDKINFYTMAKASLLEVESQILIAKDLGYISEKDSSNLVSDCDRIGRLISGMIKSAESWK